MEPMLTLPAELKRLRKERDLSQEQLADRVALTQATLSRYEGGKRQPSVSTLARLAPALGVTSYDFGSGKFTPSTMDTDDARLRQLCESAIALAQAGAQTASVAHAAPRGPASRPT